MRAFLRLVSVAAVCAIVPATAYAQASIAGQVKDSSGAVLPGVTVEASSPALIEKTRSVITDGTGQYRIENLRPGAYTVTFTLPGFNTVKRDGIELTGAFAATINAELRVGALEETITVSGVTPVVDVQSATRQRVMDQAVTDAIPSGRIPKLYAALIPGVVSGAPDVGGTTTSGNLGGALSIHGTNGNDSRTTQSGINWNTVGSFGSTTPALPNMSAIQEVTVDYAAVSAELGQGGVRVNFIPREGGNTFKGTAFGSFTNNSLEADNFTQDLKTRGLGTPDAIRKNWDTNVGYGGPIRTDKVWFFAAVRYNGSGVYTGGMFYNKNANKPNVWTYEPDTSRPASNDSKWKDAQARVTWQANAKNKLAFSYDQQYICNCLATVAATLAPEAARYWYFPLERGVTAEWSSPLTNRVLLEAVALARHERYIMDRPRDLSPLMINVVDQLNGLSYRARDAYANNYTPNFSYRFAASYITGAHAVKVGFNNITGSVNVWNFDNQPVSYRVNSQTGVPVPNQITIRALPYRAINKVDHDAGFFAQDKWAIDRLTVTGGVRFDIFDSSFPEQTIGPALLTPTRNFSFPETPNLGWKDVTPKTGLSYDVFGNGKTAFKATLNKYVAGQGATGGLGSATNPANTIITSTSRSWTDTNRDFVPDCDLTNPVANGECGAMANANFGKQVPGTTYDPDILRGWGKRGFDWEFSTGLQHEILPRVSMDVSYFRRWFGNFLVTDNLAVATSEYDKFSITAPVDPRLPNGGGSTISGVFDLNPSKFGVPTNNLATFASNYGKQIQHWNGLDVTVDARPRAGMFLQGGISTGKTVTDNCEVAAKVPESLLASPLLTVANAGTWLPLQYCHQEAPFQTQVKFLGSYTVPKIDVQFSGTLQSLLGPLVAANFNLPTAQAAQTLGRPLSGGAANLTVDLVQPGTMYGERLNQLDLRFAKIIRYRQTRTAFNVDIFNALNSDTVLTLNNAFGAWLRPTSIITARFVKFSAQVDF